MKYSLRELESIIEPKSTHIEIPDTVIDNIAFDSRRIVSYQNSIFFAIKTAKNDGHNYIGDAYSKGVMAFVVDHTFESVSKYPGASFLKVDNTIDALQKLAAHHRTRFKKPVVAITGSNGKTILKEWIYFLLKDQFAILRSPGSFNSQIGVPVSLLKIDHNHELAIIEAGISKQGEMTKLEKIISPDIGIFTNLGNAHDSGFISKNQKLEEKIELFKNCKKIICCADDEDVFFKIKNKFSGADIISWTQKNHQDANLHINPKRNGNSTLISYSLNNIKGEFSIGFSDKISLKLAVTAFLAGLVLGGQKTMLSKKAQFLLYPKMRMEIKRGINNCTLLNDTYNSDIDSIKNALNYLKIDKNNKKTLIISDVFQTGFSDNELFEILKNLIEDAGISKLILVGEKILSLSNYFNNKLEIHKFESTDELLKNIDKLNFKNEFILLKGARKFKFEKIFEYLSEIFHHTVLEIDLNTISENINVFKSFLKKETKILAVIKASGYGAGAEKLAWHLEAIGVNYIGVAFLDEAIELRKSGLNIPILVFNPDLSYIEKFVRYDIEPVIYSLRQLERLSTDQEFKIHIKLDTGMKRLGFEPKDISQLTKALNSNKNIKVISIFSHLAASNDPNADKFTLDQIEKFKEMCLKISDQTGRNFIKHILNSSGIIRFARYQMDMVRLGAGMHGIDTSGELISDLTPSNSLKTYISQIKNVKPREPIGYGMKCKKDHERRIAIIPVGYADGLLRQAGNNNFKVWVNGEFAPVIGDVNMDMSFIDITGLNDIKEGDEVEIFGKNSRIEDLAKAGNTIFYEILSRISQRVKRVYFN